jgi:hypothetical protein
VPSCLSIAMLIRKPRVFLMPMTLNQRSQSSMTFESELGFSP